MLHNEPAYLESAHCLLWDSIFLLHAPSCSGHGLIQLQVENYILIYRPFRYGQIPQDYTMEVTNRLKGLDLIERVPEELWMEVHDVVQEAVIKTIPKKNKCKRAKWLSEKAYKQLRKEVKGKGEKEKYTHLNAEFQRKQGEIRKPSSVMNTKKQRKTIEWERLEISSRKLEIPREHFMQRWAQ